MHAPDFNAKTPDALVWKMIYLARRNPALAPEDFPQAWREHSALGRQCRNVGERVLSVAQCSRLLDVPLPGSSADYDGVNLLVLRDRDAATMIWSDPETLAVMRPDDSWDGGESPPSTSVSWNGPASAASRPGRIRAACSG